MMQADDFRPRTRRIEGGMLNAAPDRLTAALEELDPGARALLDLSLRRGIRDEDLADLLKTEPSEVARQRADAIERVAAGVGSSASARAPEVRTALAELPPESWGSSPPTPLAPPAALVAPEPARASSRRWLSVVLLLVAVGAAVAGLVAAGAYHGGDAGSPRPAEPKPLASKAPLTALDGGSARGTAHISGQRLDLSVSGLRRKARYQVWLYDSIADAVPVGTFAGPSARVHPRVPAGASRHRYLDVSLEPSDGNPNHSGQSVLRAPLSKRR
jgi:hypothetical protein